MDVAGTVESVGKDVTGFRKDLLLVKELIEAGKITPVIDRTFALSEVPDAFRYLEKGHGSGKVVVIV